MFTPIMPTVYRLSVDSHVSNDARISWGWCTVAELWKVLCDHGYVDSVHDEFSLLFSREYVGLLYCEGREMQTELFTAFAGWIIEDPGTVRFEVVTKGASWWCGDWHTFVPAGWARAVIDELRLRNTPRT